MFTQEEKPIYFQMAELIEDAILSGAFLEESQIPSTTELSVNYKINPATALKGINILVDNNIVYKKRGVGMFVAKGAVDIITENRKKLFIEDFVAKLVDEAKKLNISKKDVIELIEGGYTE